MLQANVQVEASAPVVLLLLEYFESIKHASVNFASGTVDYRPPHYPEPQLSAWQFF